MQYSIMTYNKVRQMTDDFRFDADYFHPKYLQEDALRSHVSNIYINDFCFVTDGQHGYHEVDYSSPIFHLTAKNAKDWFANTEGADRIAKWVDDKNKRSSLTKNDLILSTRGTVGLCALVTPEVLPANIDQDVARIKVNRTKSILPEYLLAYLNCSFGQDWLIRNISGMVQQGLSLDKVRKIPVPRLSEKFQLSIKRIIEKSYFQKNKGQISYAKAEEVLLSANNLLSWKPKHRSFFIKNFSDTQSANRIDAEYYQPLYEEIVEKIKHYKYGFAFMEEMVKIKDNIFMPKDDVVYKYIELSNISANGHINGCIEARGRELPTRARHKINEGDVVVSSIEGSLSSIALITKDFHNSLCSTGFIVISSDLINSESLLVLLKSKLGQLQLKKGCSGTILTAISNGEFRKIILPKLSEKVQKDIKEKISKTYESKAIYGKLLEIAKRGVEMAIEKDEKEAQQWINFELQKLNVIIRES